MERVRRITRNEIELSGAHLLPTGAGVIVFSKINTPLYYLSSNRLQKLWEKLTFDEEEHQQRDQLANILSEYDSLTIYSTFSPLESLIVEKRLLLKERPRYYQQVRLYDHHSYLGINLENPPFLSSKPDTVEDQLYLGPFPDSFFVNELIGRFNDYQKTPACPSDSFPCHLLDENRCPGYCLQKSKNELIEAIVKNYFSIDYQYLNQLKGQKEELLDNLNFSKADELQKEIEFYEDYYQRLRFFATFKNYTGTFELCGVVYEIRNGLLESVASKNSIDDFRPINQHFSEYTENETFALQKSDLREMWTTFQVLDKVHPDLIDKMFNTTSQKIREKLRNKMYER